MRKNFGLDMKKKVCFIVTDAISFNILCCGQLEYLRDTLGSDIWLVCGGEEKEIIELRRRAIGQVVFIPFARAPSIVRDLRCFFYLVRFLFRNDFDLVVYSTPKALLLGSVASFVTRQKCRVGIVRGRVYENYKGLKKSLFQVLDRLALRVSNEVIFISDSLKTVYEQENIVPFGKGVVLAHGSSNGVDVERFRNEDTKSDDYLNVVSVGRVCRDKGIVELYEIIKKVSEATSKVRFVVVGRIEDDISNSLINELAAAGSLTYLPHTTNIEKVFQQADLHLFLSHREGFGNVALEAAATGVPTFSFDVVGVMDSVKSGISGERFPLYDTTSIANEIIRAAENIHGFRQSYPAAREWATSHFSQQTVWKAYLDFYKQKIES